VRHRFTALTIVALLGAAGCGGASSNDGASSPAPPARTAAQPATAAVSPAPRCHTVPRTTVRLIASHANPKTRFDLSAAAAIHVRSGYAVSLVALAGGRQRMATWVVDRLRGAQTVTSGNVQALRVTNWPLDSLEAAPLRQSQICAAKKLRGVGPVAP
jgi:hypothetical protein